MEKLIKKKLKTNDDEELSRKNGSGLRSSKDIMILKAQLARYLTVGLTLEEASKLVGAKSRLIGSLRSDPEFEEFIQKCTIENKTKYVEAIRLASDNGYWQAAAWYLERKFPEEFAKKDIVKHQYEVKLMTFQNVVLNVIEAIDPKLRMEVLRRLKDYEWNGEGAMDQSFHCLPAPKEDDEIIDMNEFCIKETIDI